MAKITYDNKVSLNPQPSVANINKVSDADMNEIKSVVNENAVETGSNANGSWIKFENGTMICWKTTIFPSLAITDAFQGVYYANSGDVNFPQTFYSVPVVNVLTSIGGGGFTIYGGTSLTTQYFKGFFWKTQSATMEVICHWVAYGRWK